MNQYIHALWRHNMNIGNAIKIGVATVVGVKLAIGSFNICRDGNRYNKKREYLRNNGYQVEQLIFKTEAELDAMMEAV